MKKKFLFIILVFLLICISFQLTFKIDNWFSLFMIIPGLIIGFIIAVIIHELGHLVFGLLSGYKFSSFKILFIKIYKREKLKISFERFFLAIPGQCLMKPTNSKYLLYNLGGLIFTYSLSLTLLILSYIIDNDFIVQFFFGILIINTILAILNSLYRDDGINDICNIVRCRNSKEYLEGVLFQLDLSCNIYNNDKFKSKYNPSDDVGDFISNLSIYRLRYFKAYHEKNTVKLNHYYLLLKKSYRNIYFPFLKYPLLVLLLNHEFIINKDISEIKRLLRLSNHEKKKLSKFKEEYDIYNFYQEGIINKKDYELIFFDKFLIKNNNDLITKLNNKMFSKVQRLYKAYLNNEHIIK